jgi:hypothetical protein
VKDTGNIACIRGEKVRKEKQQEDEKEEAGVAQEEEGISQDCC